MPRKLKVYRTPIGFHDAYVAAPSQKAALEAWGTDRNLFARGDAEEVVDAELVKEPLAQPGKVIRRSRGTTAEQIAALPADRPKADEGRTRGDGPSLAEAKTKAPGAKRDAAPKPKPKPNRDALDRAEQAVAEAEERHRAARDRLGEREDELARERRRLEADQDKELSALRRSEEKQPKTYGEAMSKWRG
ncbi:hypothetical protein PQ455_13770 [Sphingomonas naphthae]|uniref:Cell envelope biogenesis protein TolA n=1 Tax=Sphingomonas naphthae TaxID=1813468 RepID=A0ABY7THP6_9SPHN|nr:hypothetical protein [Sphingomonas naphthae]WCT72695.1 hypothetical protein PQ455_13770 [Sphingomonas naphthae]